MPQLFAKIQHYVDLRGLRMHYAEAGPPDGAPIILLHGFPEFWYSWRLQIPALAAAGYRVIAPDQRGYNLSSKDGPYDIATLTADIAHLQDALGIASSHIAGHDWGGAVAWAFAAAYPERTDRLVILNAPHLNAYEDTVRRHPRQLLKSWYILFFQLPRLPEWSLRAGDYAVLRRAFARVPHMTAADIARYTDAWARPGALSATVGWYRAMARGIIAHRGNLPALRVASPTLVIWGERDAVLDRACNDTLPRYVPDLRINYLPASHWVQLDKPDEVNRLLLAFLHDPDSQNRGLRGASGQMYHV